MVQSAYKVLMCGLSLHFCLALVLAQNQAGADKVRAHTKQEKPVRPGHIRSIRLVTKLLSESPGEPPVEYPSLSTEVIYDEQGRVIEQAEYLPDGSPDIKSTFKYDELGNVIEYASYVHGSVISRWVATYRGKGRLDRRANTEGHSKGEVATCEVAPKSERSNCVARDSDGSIQRRWTSVYDGEGREIEQLEFDPDGKQRGRYVNAYDARGNRIEETHYYKSDGKPGSSKTVYKYDGQDNLVEESLFFDGVLEKTERFRRNDKGDLIERVRYDAKGSVIEASHMSYVAFDARGMWTKAINSSTEKRAGQTEEMKRVLYRTIVYRVDAVASTR